MSTINSENDEILLELLDASGGTDVILDQVKEYQVNQHFLTPCAGWEFTIEADSISETARKRIIAGAPMRLTCNGLTQFTGYIDGMRRTASRGGGTIMHVRGRDRLGQAVRGGADPYLRFTDGTNLHDALAAIFAPFGYRAEDIVVGDGENRSIVTGTTRGVRLSKGGKKRGPRELKKFRLHQTMPYPAEGAYAYAARIANRFGLWIWASADGSKLIVDTPDFDQAPLYALRALKGSAKAEDDPAATSILDGEADENNDTQASLIVAEGWSPGGEHDSGHMAVIVFNELCCTDASGALLPEVQALVAKFPHARKVPLRGVFAAQMRTPHNFVHAIYRKDQESQTPEQLEYFARREMSLLQRSQYSVSYEIEGHAQDGVPWSMNAVVAVEDDYRDVHEPLWIMGRTFYRSHSGTKTRLELIRRYTLEMGATGDQDGGR